MILTAVVPSSIINKPNVSIRIDWEPKNLLHYSFVNAIKKELLENNQSEYCFGTAKMTVYDDKGDILHQFVPHTIKPFEPPYEPHNPEQSQELTLIKKAINNLKKVIEDVKASLAKDESATPAPLDKPFNDVKEIDLEIEQLEKLMEDKKTEQERRKELLAKLVVNDENVNEANKLREDLKELHTLLEPVIEGIKFIEDAVYKLEYRGVSKELFEEIKAYLDK